MYNKQRFIKCHVLIVLITVQFVIPVCISQPRVQKIRQITVEDGLLTPGVKSTYKDSYGFMWFAFSNGIARYDGYTVKRYDDFLPDSCAINSYKFCTSFQEDNDGNLWIGTLKNGFAKLDRETETFTYYNSKSSGENGVGYNTVHCMTLDREGDLWLGSGDYGIFKFIPEADSFVNYNPFDIIPDPAVTHVLSLLEDNSGKLWIGTGGGIFQFDRKTGLFTHIPTNPKIPARLNIICRIAEDKYGDLWFGTDWGVFRYEPGTKKWKHYFTENPDKPNDYIGAKVIGLAEVDKGKTHQMWIGTNTGCLVYDYATDKMERLKTQNENQESPFTGGTKNLFFDGDLLWASTNGITLIDPMENPFQYKRIFSYPDSISEIDSWCFYEDRDRQLWVGTFNDGLYQFDQNLDFVANYKPTVWGRENAGKVYRNRITLVFEDSDGNLWVGTSGEGLSVFDRTDKSFTPVSFEKPTGRQEMIWVSAILEDSYGILWFATHIGLFRTDIHWQENQSPVLIDHPVLANVSVAGLMEDSQGRLWVTTYNQGIFCMSPENRETLGFKRYFHKFYNQGLFITRNVREMYEDIEGQIWMLSETALFKFNEKSDSIEYQEFFDKVHKGEHYVITGDSLGNLWFVSEIGRLVRYNPKDSSDRCLKVFDDCDGLYYDGIVYTSFGKSKTGHLYFGGGGPDGSGFCRFHPDSIYEDNQGLPEVVLTGFKIRNVVAGLDSSVAFKKHIRLKYNQNFFSFEFAALDYRDPSKNHHAYMLEGLDDDWTYCEDRRFANYTGVAPGEYTFRVKGSNNDGYWNEKGASIMISISPPPWKTWWAYSLYTIFIALLTFAWRRYDIKRQRLKRDLEIEHIETEKLKELDKMKSRFFANISHEFRTPLTLILGPLEGLISQKGDEKCIKDLNMMQRNARRLQRLINQLLNLSKLDAGEMKLIAGERNIVSMVRGYTHSFESLAKQKNIKLEFLSEDERILIYVDNDKMEKILFNLLSNAFKFTPKGGKVTVSVVTHPVKPVYKEGTGDGVKIVISDTGPGIPPDKVKYIFDRFYQVGHLYNGDQEGSGIGLALAQELVKLHSGEIKVESMLGTGTSFTITLPKGYEHLKAGEIMKQTATGPIDKLIIPEAYPLTTGPVEDQAEEKLKANDLRPLLLIVEDNDDLRAYIRSYLTNSYVILEAIDGEAGLQKSIENIPDIVVSDVMMPKMDGMEFCRKLKTDERTSHIPIILLTAKAAIEDKLEGLETGADDFLTKPFDPKELRIRISNLIVQRSKLREQFIRELDITGQMASKDILSIDRQFLQKAKKTVEENMSDFEFSIENFADKMDLSRIQLHRKLKALLSQSSGDFLRTVRLNHATHLIKSKSGNISQIAYEVGFNNLSWFSKCFREQFGVLPSEYANQNNKT